MSTITIKFVRNTTGTFVPPSTNSAMPTLVGPIVDVKGTYDARVIGDKAAPLTDLRVQCAILSTAGNKMTDKTTQPSDWQLQLTMVPATPPMETSFLVARLYPASGDDPALAFDGPYFLKVMGG